MTFEGLLKSELSKIKALNDNIYPLSVPESVKAPYIAYCLADGKYLKTLDGEEPWELTYEINILADKYSDLKPLEKVVETVLRELKGKQTEDGKVTQIDVQVPNEKHEEAVNLQRANIQFTVYF